MCRGGGEIQSFHGNEVFIGKYPTESKIIFFKFYKSKNIVPFSGVETI